MAESQGSNIVNVVKSYSQRLFSFIRGRVRSEEDAEDILQDVWLQLSRVVDLEDLENVGSWLYRTARNRIIDRYRKKTDLPMGDEFFDEDSDDAQSLLLGEDAIPEDEFFSEIFWEELMAALDELPDKQREVFVKNELDGMTLQEIADELGTNLKTVISRKRYAVARLRERLQELYNELNDL